MFHQCNQVVEQYQEVLTDEEWKSVMLLLQPQHLMRLDQKQADYAWFVNGMNVLTAIGLRHL